MDAKPHGYGDYGQGMTECTAKGGFPPYARACERDPEFAVNPSCRHGAVGL
jgi:hypothetical protein